LPNGHFSNLTISTYDSGAGNAVVKTALPTFPNRRRGRLRNEHFGYILHIAGLRIRSPARHSLEKGERNIEHISS